MLDGQNTTYDWQKHTGTVCVWAVGSFEQHSVHLPLATDTMEADVFARFVAEELDAPLLPTFPFGTSLEMTGFRGTLTLHPETLMQVVRDVAEEVERQSFRTLVIVNGHGGNHCLVPVARDINRANRPIKLLLVDFWAHGDPKLADARDFAPTFHAEAWETSLMLALYPDCVGTERADIPASPEHPSRFVQQDLTTFGVGHFSPKGAVGFPSGATREKGEAIVASIRERIVPFIRERIEWLEQDRHYSGCGGLAVRRMEEADIPDAMRLKDAEGWNQVEADWRLYLDLAPDGCFVAVHNGRVIGTAAGIEFEGRVAWIGMVLVDPRFRHKGLATELVRKVLAAVDHCDCVKLDATPAGRPVYEKLGFVPEYGLSRLMCDAVPALDQELPRAEHMGSDPLDRVVELDADIFGANRAALLGHLYARAPEVVHGLKADGMLHAVCLGRDGQHGFHMGPVLAADVAGAKSVIAAALRPLTGRAVMFDVPDAQVELKQWLVSLGFVVQRPFARMFLGHNVVGDPARCFALAGPELG